MGFASRFFNAKITRERLDWHKPGYGCSPITNFEYIPSPDLEKVGTQSRFKRRYVNLLHDPIMTRIALLVNDGDFSSLLVSNQYSTMYYLYKFHFIVGARRAFMNLKQRSRGYAYKLEKTVIYGATTYCGPYPRI
jgi:hypothetical protein